MRSAEERYFIGEKIILFNPESKYPMQHPCGSWIKEEDAIKEKRYAIHGHDTFGLTVEYLPARIYESLIDDVCFNARYSAIKKTNKYKKEVDSWLFKYYDDADEVMQNIIRFISWAKKNQTKKIKKVTGKLIKDFSPSKGWLEKKVLSIGLNESAKRRKSLSSFRQEVESEMDLLEP